MPEPPKASFFQGVSTLFSGNQKETVDLDTICMFFPEFPLIICSRSVAEKPANSTTVSSVKSVARQIPSSSLNKMESAQSQNISAGQAAARKGFLLFLLVWYKLPCAKGINLVNGPEDHAFILHKFYKCFYYC
jgi:hypothetical protein